MADDDGRYMRMALGLAARGLGTVWPNPAVGCVLVRDGVVVGRGWTQPGGRPHAEVRALAQAGAAARGATAYVTLEPCAHHGKTPPCAEALIAAGVVRVVTALTDPDSRVSGRGHAMLRAAGIPVTEGVEAEAAHRANLGFLLRVREGRPMVTLKLALTLDARIATASGESRWITGPEARRRVHLMRARHDAVLVGSGTARADDPDLTVRDLGIDRQPVRIVTDSRLGVSADSRLGRGARQSPVWMLHGPHAPAAAREAWSARGAELVPCATDPMGRLDVGAAVRALGARGLTRVFCEGGGGLGASLIAAGLVDELVVFSAGRLFGADGTPGLAGLGVTRIGPRDWALDGVESVGSDLMHRWRRLR
ncbi:MAG: bifunctional diaminohydroxyphosphoribosylaminopyrimidine deaminase/5-amino-6-(5-phosphoribosylamino)uracil reductase RibD [Rhodobacter sp.]|nr:bifunctional diaminohydroxyphosphoribosylaminopyrimidine deaminase/5-amino-6-(5-phosphoribosylamino)uracil reductase RibD [Paracoccaceae bacterium]MCB1409347.1 bifunctional diaminohydroxyphosphoribosylaminopyrimidine deaminase/5-amino-6-(5-phosphoribosylamino)uracil reductase RibD [Paracoccaceae bacterium]MCC0078591.1 bifunctional diaminohydroxyphosphoribosylaminopyrimidine deaminase/5-amino-6-(5-phosphoribosylamino)uracil reductase RibD [Rhodobacter sp.]